MIGISLETTRAPLGTTRKDLRTHIRKALEYEGCGAEMIQNPIVKTK